MRGTGFKTTMLQKESAMALIEMPSNLQLGFAVPEDFSDLVGLAATCKVFSPAELAALEDDLDSCDKAAQDFIVVARDGTTASTLLGFIQYSPAPITQGSWYIYWLAVAKAAQGKGVGGQLLTYAEEHIHSMSGRVLRIETSDSTHYHPTRQFYLAHHYLQVAKIPDYYAAGDHKCIFQKYLGE